MTQMGLDYMKHLETGRANRANEAIQSRNAASNERNAATNEKDAKTRAFTASFEPRKVAATESQASSSARQAQVAEDKQRLSEQYAEREMQAKEQTADASILRGAGSIGKTLPSRLQLSTFNDLMAKYGIPESSTSIKTPEEGLSYFTGLLNDLVKVLTNGLFN